jgi:hypothetical protein
MPGEVRRMLELFLLLLLAHFAGDFVFQDEDMAQKKNGGGKTSQEVQSLLFHASIHFLLYLGVIVILVFGLHYSDIKWLFLIATLLAVSHLIIDWKKPCWECIGINNRALIFMLDQALHISIIILIINWLSKSSILTVLQSFELSNFFETVIFVIIGIILITDFSNIFIRLFLETIKGPVNEEVAINKYNDDGAETAPELSNPINNKENYKKTGRYIGNLERSLTFLAVISGAYEVLIGIYGTKTAMRFYEFNNKDFAEYYFIGTLLSALLAISIALFYRWVLG